jgi:hypothetical protein
MSLDLHICTTIFISNRVLVDSTSNVQKAFILVSFCWYWLKLYNISLNQQNYNSEHAQNIK